MRTHSQYKHSQYMQLSNQSHKSHPPSTTPVVYMDISDGDKLIGTIHIKMFPDAFPAGVDNFIQIASGNTYQITMLGSGDYKYERHVKRTFEGCRIFNFVHNLGTNS